MKIWYESDTFDTEGYGVIRYYNYLQYLRAMEFIQQVQVEYVLPKTIIKSGYTLQFEINDRNTFYQIREDFYKYL